jgi:hypothetical protein
MKFRSINSVLWAKMYHSLSEKWSYTWSNPLKYKIFSLLIKLLLQWALRVSNKFRPIQHYELKWKFISSKPWYMGRSPMRNVISSSSWSCCQTFNVLASSGTVPMWFGNWPVRKLQGTETKASGLGVQKNNSAQASPDGFVMFRCK